MKKTRTIKQQQRLFIIVFLSIPLILLIMLTLYPAISQVGMSFMEWDGISPEKNFVGLDNYKDIFSDKTVWMTLENNLAYIVTMIIQSVLGLIFAVFLNTKLKAKNLYKSVLFMPYVLNSVAVAFMFNFLYDFSNGPLNAIIKSLGGDPVTWLPNNYLINFSLGTIGVWKYTGFTMVLFLGALQSVPLEIYEASKVDGAGFLKELIYITIPNIKTTIEIVLLIGINGALNCFFEPYMITKGGPAGRSHTFVTKMLNIAFDFRNFGKAAALSVILIIIIGIALFIVKRAMRGKE